MSNKIKADIAIIGAGSGGLSVAAGAAQMGAKVVLIEKHKMGGDCLNTGCVPSKALIAAGEAAHTVRESGQFGVNGHEPASTSPRSTRTCTASSRRSPRTTPSSASRVLASG